MELSQSTYLTDEAAPWRYDDIKAARLRSHLTKILTTLADLAPTLGAKPWSDPRKSTRKNTRDIYPATGSEITAKSWLTEAPMRMLMNNLHPDVAENPHELVVYGGIGRAARTWEDFDKIVSSLKKLEDDETLLVQSGKPVGVFQTHKDAPRVLIANSNLVPHWANWDHFNELDKKGLMMYGPDDCGLVDLHRQSGHRSRHL